MLGTQRDVKWHFKSLQERVKNTFSQPDEATREPSIADNEDSSVNEEEDDGDLDDPTETLKDPYLSGHRQLFGPIVRLDPFTSTSTQFSPFFKPQEANACLEMDDELMADATDEDDIQQELYEEEEINKLDEIAAQDAEQELWSRVQVEAPPVQGGPNRTSSVAPDAPEEPESPRKRANKSKAPIEGEGGKLRFANPGRKGIIKSAVYVEDSD